MPRSTAIELTAIELFAGIGACALAAKWAGFQSVQFVEIDPFCQRVLTKNFPGVPIHGDITTFSGNDFRGRTSIVCGGFPCTDISATGRGAGIDGEHSSLWFEMLRVVREVEPLYVLVENSPAIRVRGIDRVLDGLEEIGYTGESFVVGSGNAGAPHQRQRCFVVAHSDRHGTDARADGGYASIGANRNGVSQGAKEKRQIVIDVLNGRVAGRVDSDSACAGLEGEDGGKSGQRISTGLHPPHSPWGTNQPPFPGVGPGTPGRMDPHRLDRIKALGNCNPPYVYYPFLKAIADDLRRPGGV